MKAHVPLRVLRRCAAAVTVTVLVGACGSARDSASDTSRSTATAGDTGDETYAVVSNAAVAQGLAALMPLAAASSSQIASGSEGAEAAVAAMYEKWFEFEGTVRRNDQGTYLDLEDALGAIKAAQTTGDAAKAAKGAADLASMSSAYLAKFPADAAAAETAPALGAAARTVLVGLDEWGIDTPDTLEHGIVNFSMTNRGKEPHEFVVFRTDLAVGDLPLDDEGGVDEKGAGVQLVDERENIKPGTGVDLKVELLPGNYVFACNILNHFKNGMVKSIRVT